MQPFQPDLRWAARNGLQNAENSAFGVFLLQKCTMPCVERPEGAAASAAALEEPGRLGCPGTSWWV